MLQHNVAWAGGCVKYTNKWAEAEEAEGGRREVGGCGEGA